ncbi:MAG: CRISPR-associated helicase Cas3' [candidate division Zixibacteria bacterium]|nr:CRISPR-associated helicase Cas3' [candidate division Zixibacteria bacterium]
MSYYKYWGKADQKSSSGSSYHLLAYHSLDVAAVGDVLLRHNKDLRVSLSRLTNLPEQVFQRWMVFLLSLHDIGKFSDSFQNLKPELLEELQGRQCDCWSTERHDKLGSILWKNNIKTVVQRICGGVDGVRTRRASQPIDYWAQSVLEHHGQPLEYANHIVFDDYLHCPDDIDAVESFVESTASLLLSGDNAITSMDSTQLQQASWWLAGFTVLCDWLGSNKDDFHYHSEEMPLSDYWQQTLKTAERAIEKAELLPKSHGRALCLVDFFTGHTKNSITPTLMQSQAMELPLSGGPQLFLVEDVTGSGKTEAAVLLASRLMLAGKGNGIYFALPTMATANAMYGRMRNVYRLLFDANANPSLVLAHSARDLSGEFRDSVLLNPVFQDQEYQEYGDKTMSAAAHCSAWLADNRKKALLAEIGVGTIDQALLAILPSRHQSLRLLGLLHKILVVDEVHAYDSYTHQLLCALLKAHSAAGGSTILLSATLPAEQRQALVDAYTKGNNWQKQTLNKTGNSDYPLLTHCHTDGLNEYLVATRDAGRRIVSVTPVHKQYEAEVILEKATSEGQCACWIRNTVADAREAYTHLKRKHPDWSIDLFHARFAMADRLEIENRILCRFGPESTPKGRRGRILIATQVVEQSLDLDFDVMVTDLAPIDIIIQRAGRLCRHKRNSSGDRHGNPDERGTPVLHLYGPMQVSDPKEGWYSSVFPKAAKVYGNHGQLWLTARLLTERKQLCLPDDTRLLIESVYSQTAQAAIPQGLIKSALDEEGNSRARAALGVMNALNLPAGYRHDSANMWQDEDITPTRLGEQTKSVYLARWQDGHLSPWANCRYNQWALSVVQAYRYVADKKAEYNEIPQEAIEACQEELPAKRKWGVLVPLMPIGNNLWRGYARNDKEELVNLYYDSERGLMTEKENSIMEDMNDESYL